MSTSTSVRYWPGGKFEGYNTDEELFAVLDKDEEILTEEYNTQQLYYVVSRFYYLDGEEKIYSDYSDIESSGVKAKLGISNTDINLKAYINTDYKITSYDAKSPQEVNLYNVRFNLTGVDTSKYMIREYKVYSNLKAGDGLTNITNFEDYDAVYIDLYAENIYKEKYTKPRRFGGQLDNTYLIAEVSGTIELSAQQLKNADANGDGKINQADYDVLLKKVMAQNSTELNMAPSTPLS